MPRWTLTCTAWDGDPHEYMYRISEPRKIKRPPGRACHHGIVCSHRHHRNAREARKISASLTTPAMTTIREATAIDRVGVGEVCRGVLPSTGGCHRSIREIHSPVMFNVR